MSKKIVLTITLADNIEADTIIETLNAEVLCRLEDDDKFITGWEWIY
jgi:hypothetical protein